MSQCLNWTGNKILIYAVPQSDWGNCPTAVCPVLYRGRLGQYCLLVLLAVVLLTECQECRLYDLVSVDCKYMYLNVSDPSGRATCACTLNCGYGSFTPSRNKD